MLSQKEVQKEIVIRPKLEISIYGSAAYQSPSVLDLPADSYVLSR